MSGHATLTDCAMNRACLAGENASLHGAFIQTALKNAEQDGKSPSELEALRQELTAVQLQQMDAAFERINSAVSVAVKEGMSKPEIEALRIGMMVEQNAALNAQLSR